MERSSREKISKETQALNNTLDQRNLIDTYRKHSFKKHQKTYSFQMVMEHSPGQFTYLAPKGLSKFKEVETKSSIFSKQNTLRLEINYKRKFAKKQTCGG